MKRFVTEGNLLAIVRREFGFAMRLVLAFSIAFSSVQMCRLWLSAQTETAQAQTKVVRVIYPGVQTPSRD